jgi:hypothetical protein
MLFTRKFYVNYNKGTCSKEVFIFLDEFPEKTLIYHGDLILGIGTKIENFNFNDDYPDVQLFLLREDKNSVIL